MDSPVAEIADVEVAVRSDGDTEGAAARGRNGELGDFSRWGDAPDVVTGLLGEPHIAIGTGGNAIKTIGGRWDIVFSNNSRVWRYFTNFV